ncbi:MAG: histidine kinase [Zoogloeaceae bacterium]|jgi:two-component system sensor histidine kinase AlgZ|nr:histidine kinase [Zoogloeaceae bacterium]
MKPDHSSSATALDRRLPEPGSIRQKTGQDSEADVQAALLAERISLPDWRNLGVLLRALLGANLMAALAALTLADSFMAWLQIFIENAAWVEILLLSCLLLLAVFRDFLHACSYRTGQALTLLLTALCAWGLWSVWHMAGLTSSEASSGFRVVALTLAVAATLLFYFDQRARAFAPHVEAARLAALNARIRPHFLFNALNTVLALIRVDPRRAETALEELSDLFRALTRNPQELVSLADEIALAQHYLDIEKLRLGERLRVVWKAGEVPMDLLMPPLILQPLLENAVHYGVAPSPTGNEIRVRLRQKGEMLEIAVANPIPSMRETDKPHGNQMALSNIRARLALFYDMEARLEHGPRNHIYHVRIELPCRFKTSPP